MRQNEAGVSKAKNFRDTIGVMGVTLEKVRHVSHEGTTTPQAVL